MESIFNLRDLLSSNAECWKQINEIHECPCKMPRESAPDTVKSYKANIINSDFKVLLSSAIFNAVVLLPLNPVLQPRRRGVTSETLLLIKESKVFT